MQSVPVRLSAVCLRIDEVKQKNFDRDTAEGFNNIVMGLRLALAVSLLIWISSGLFLFLIPPSSISLLGFSNWMYFYFICPSLLAIIIFAMRKNSKRPRLNLESNKPKGGADGK